ncbi:hypothetical protein OIDMADRAFT_52734 [Oidiodendron maius Zn]|uniref:CorA-like transporter domain-containing protein n=1 Tax=Oidiodendron maius (strain Zn) TaxID=913774 RepID=A0A0C3H3X7_OIDMZ|nr:hypothetical protein OIDMADRAFT_52734 [Oidiodendron maius Zn]
MATTSSQISLRDLSTSSYDEPTTYAFVCEELPSLGERYPIDVDCYTPAGEDRGLCDQKLSEESLTLFQLAGGGIDVLWSARDDKSRKSLSQRYFVASEEVEEHGIYKHLQGKSWEHLIVVIQPAFSWSHLSVTEPAFRKILASLQVFTPFLRVVHAFGKKTNDKQRVRDLAYYHVQPSLAYEFCYNIRYFELNGRGRGNPWSLRQTGVYQRFLSNKRSAWLLLNSSSYIGGRVSAALEEASNLVYGSCEVSVLLPHLFIVSAATRNWGPYIENLRQKVMTFEEKAYSSRINKKDLNDYDLLFSDVQKIILLGDTITMVRLHKRASGQCNCDMESTLRMLRADLHHYLGAVTVLARTASRVAQLLSAILATRANDNLRATAATIQTGIAELQLKSVQTCLDIGQLLQVTMQGHKDAATIKILAQISTMFLPASLTASLFSSTIFSNRNSNISYVGLYFAITIPLSLVTLLLLVLLESGSWPPHFQNRAR